MGANTHKVANPINVIQALPDRVVGSAQTLKASFDNVGEIVRLKHDALCDYIDEDIATKSELSSVTVGLIPDNTITYAKLESTLQAMLNPVGSIITMAIGTVPSGYLECDGSNVSRTTYSNLFSAIGTLYGVGDGSTTFKLPDLRGEFLRGWDNGRGVDTGRTVGSAQDGSELTVESDYLGGSTMKALKYSNLNKDADGAVRPRNIAVMYCIRY